MNFIKPKFAMLAKNGPNAIQTFFIVGMNGHDRSSPNSRFWICLFIIVKPRTFNHLTVDWPSNPQKILVITLVCAASVEPFIPTATTGKIST